MNTNLSETSGVEDDTLRPEYDFRGAVRGKHHRAYRQGHTVTIHGADGSVIVQEFEPEADVIILDPDVRAVVPDAESVNRTLRALIALVPPRDRRSP